MSGNSHSSKFQDVLARMKATKTAADENSKTESSSMRVSSDSITASTIQKPRDIGVKPIQFSSIKKETIAPIVDVTADMEAASEIERRRQEFHAVQIQSQIDSLIGADDDTIARLKGKKACERIIYFLLSDMTFIEGGTFLMGGDFENSLPKHQVTLSSFFMCKRPLYPEEWDFLLEDTLELEQEKDNKPHTMFANIDEGRLEDAAVLCRRLSKITGCNFRLQTEAEHEYAARGGKKSRGYECAGANEVQFFRRLDSWPEANELGLEFMNFACHFQPDNSYERVHGIAEWCSDYYAPYSPEPQINPRGPQDGAIHVFRSSDSPVYVRNYGANKHAGIWREADWCIRLVCDDTPEARARIRNNNR